MSNDYGVPPEQTPEEQVESLRKIKYTPMGPVIAEHFRKKIMSNEVSPKKVREWLYHDIGYKECEYCDNIATTIIKNILTDHGEPYTEIKTYTCDEHRTIAKRNWKRSIEHYKKVIEKSG